MQLKKALQRVISKELRKITLAITIWSVLTAVYEKSIQRLKTMLQHITGNISATRFAFQARLTKVVIFAPIFIRNNDALIIRRGVL